MRCVLLVQVMINCILETSHIDFLLYLKVLHEIIHPERYRGSPIPSLPGFTSLIKGFRRGEMTVLTGPTGSGKQCITYAEFIPKSVNYSFFLILYVICIILVQGRQLSLVKHLSTWLSKVSMCYGVVLKSKIPA